MELTGKRGAILAEDVYEDMELWYPKIRLTEAGAEVKVVGPKVGATYASKHGVPVTADVAADAVSADDFDAVVIPGGYSPDRMRRHASMVKLVRDMNEQGKVIAFICHGGWLPISAGILEGRRATSFFSIKHDMVNAGVDWEDGEVLVDGNLISSRTPDDLPAFMRAILAALS